MCYDFDSPSKMFFPQCGITENTNLQILVEQSQTLYQKGQLFQLQRIAIIYYNERTKFEVLHRYIQHQPSRFWLAGIAQIEEHFHTSCIH